MNPSETSPLNVTQEGHHRIFVGLGWDPNENPDLGDKIGALIGTRKAHHDLDLSCFFYDTEGACLGAVTAEPQSYSDESGAIYHSGDNVEGIGDGDDEQISVELKNLPENVVHLIFKASIKSGHHFSDVKDPLIRLCDGYTGHCFLDTSLHEQDANNNNAYVFVHISREEDGWNLRSIGEFLKNEPIERMKSILGDYLK